MPKYQKCKVFFEELLLPTLVSVLLSVHLSLIDSIQTTMWFYQRPCKCHRTFPYPQELLVLELVLNVFKRDSLLLCIPFKSMCRDGLVTVLNALVTVLNVLVTVLNALVTVLNDLVTVLNALVTVLNALVTVLIALVTVLNALVTVLNALVTVLNTPTNIDL